MVPEGRLFLWQQDRHYIAELLPDFESIKSAVNTMAINAQ